MSNMMKTIYFIRHGQTKYNIEGRFVGSTDLPLTHDGRQNIYNMWHERSIHIDKEIIYSSPMKRCVETADIIFPNEHIEIIQNLAEMHFGIFEGKTHMELMELESYRNFRTSKGKGEIPEGESGIEFGKRVLKGFFEAVAHMNKHDYNTSAIVCHGGVIMAVFSMLCAESDDIYHYHVDNGQGYKAHYNDEKKELVILERL